ncbi:LapA family protein [Rhodococcus sp. NPDC003322]
MSDQGSAKTSLMSRMTPGRWLALALVVLAVIFIFQNTATTTIQLAWFSFEAALWVFLLAVFVIGWIAGWLVGRRKSGS